MPKYRPSVDLEQVFPVRIGKQVIYTVTCHEPGVFSKKVRERSRTRVWGWFRDKRRAMASVMCNSTDMFEEGYYTYAVVEGVTSGLIPYAKQIQWFKYDHKKKTVTKIEKPAFSKSIVNYSMG